MGIGLVLSSPLMVFVGSTFSRIFSLTSVPPPVVRPLSKSTSPDSTGRLMPPSATTGKVVLLLKSALFVKCGTGPGQTDCGGTSDGIWKKLLSLWSQNRTKNGSSTLIVPAMCDQILALRATLCHCPARRFVNPFLDRPCGQVGKATSEDLPIA